MKFKKNSKIILVAGMVFAVFFIIYLGFNRNRYDGHTVTGLIEGLVYDGRFNAISAAESIAILERHHGKDIVGKLEDFLIHPPSETKTHPIIKGFLKKLGYWGEHLPPEMIAETAGLALGYIQPEGVQCLIDCLDSTNEAVRLRAITGFFGHTNLLNQSHVQAALTDLAEKEPVWDVKLTAFSSLAEASNIHQKQGLIELCLPLLESENLSEKGAAALLMVSIVGTRDEYLNIKNWMLEPVTGGTVFNWLPRAGEIIEREQGKWNYDVSTTKWEASVFGP